MAIHLIPSEKELTLRFDLERESVTDREEIESIAEDYYAMNDDDPEIRTETAISGFGFKRFDFPARAIYILK